jgi:N-methylhydantoinase A
MEEEARDMLLRSGMPAARAEITREADCRYGRQAYELTVPVAPGPITAATVAALAADFHDRHRVTYGHANPDEAVQLVNVRVSAVGKLAGLDFRAAGGRAEAVPPRMREAYFKETGLVSCEVRSREEFAPGFEGAGPLVVESMDATIVVPPGWRCRADHRGFVVLKAIAHD